MDRGTGRIYGVGSAPVVVERKQDIIEKEGDYRIVSTATTNNDIDGFDFNVDDSVKSLRFVLPIDGQSLPRNVETGKENRKATSLPLVAIL